MNFIISQKLLQKAMSVIGGCIEKKSNGIAANNVLIESLGENSVRFTAMGQDLTMRYDVTADVKKAGKLCLDGARLAAIAPTLPSGDVSFTKDDKEWAKIDAGKSKIRIAGVDAKMFPEVPSGKSTPISFKFDELRTLIKRTVFVTSEEASQYALSGVKFEMSVGEARMVGCENPRCSYATALAPEDATLDFIFPRKAAMESLKIESEDINIGDDQNHIFIEADGLLLICRKLQGKFPAYQLFFPKDNHLVASFDVAEMSQAVKRCGMFASLNTIHCELSESGAVLRAQTSEAGEIEESIAIEYSGEPITLGFDWPNLLDFLNLAGDGRFEMKFNHDPKIPALLTSEKLLNYQYILVLLNLAAQTNIAAAEAAKPKPAKKK